MTIRRPSSALTAALATALAIIAAIAAAASLAVSPAAADDNPYLIAEEPHAYGTVAEAPHQLVLTFSAPLAQETEAHLVQVLDDHGERVDTGEASISTYSLRTLIVPLKDIHDGDITVGYLVRLIVDGEPRTVFSEYSFTVDHNMVAPEGSGVDAATAAKSSQALVLWTIAILIGIAVAGGLLYFLRLATGNSRSSLEPTNRSIYPD